MSLRPWSAETSPRSCKTRLRSCAFSPRDSVGMMFSNSWSLSAIPASGLHCDGNWLARQRFARPLRAEMRAAHLKNFGVICDDVQGEARLASAGLRPRDDVSVPFQRQSRPNLTLNGSTKWPTAKRRNCGSWAKQGRLARPPGSDRYWEHIDEAIQETTKVVHAYTMEHPEFDEIGQQIGRASCRERV